MLKISSAYKLIKKYKYLILFILIFATHLFFRFYELEIRHQFAWDQVDNAWTAKNIIVEHEYPLLGMVAKQNTGMYIGPAYYYLNTLFYFVSDLDPIASPIIAGTTSIFTFIILYFVSKKIFSEEIALIAVFFYAVSFFAITEDRIQWPAAFIPSISLIIFYCLYKVISGSEKYIFPLAISLGFSFNIHFTSIFYPIIILLSAPFFPRNRKMLRYTLLSLPLFFIWIIPVFISLFQNNNFVNNYSNFVNTSYHGIHLRRIFQLIPDSLIEFEAWLKIPLIKFLKYLLIPLFATLYLLKKQTVEKYKLLFLILLWFTVPLIILSAFRGDLSNYYYSSTRLIALLIFSYLVFELLKTHLILKLSVIIFFAYYFVANVHLFFNTKYQGLTYFKGKVYKQVKESRGNEFTYGAPESYLYYFYSRKLYK